MADWYDAFFAQPDAYLAYFAPFLTPGFTETQVAAAYRWLGLAPGHQVLDLCCGQGRHSIGLAQRGVHVVGHDLSEALLALAAKAADEAGVTVTWRRGDMREIPDVARFDGVISMFSAFGYFAEDEDNVRVLHAVAAALRPGGRFLLDLNNREPAVLSGPLQRLWEPQADGRILLEEREYDVLTGRMRITLAHVAGAQRHVHDQWLRLYSVPEIIHLLRSVGLAPTNVWGDYDGSPYSLNAPRMIVRADKPDI